MKKHHKIIIIALIALDIAIAFAGCSLIPTTDNAKTRLENSIVQSYVKYVQADNNLSDVKKAELAHNTTFYNYDQFCTTVIPQYIKYVQDDNTITDPEEKQLMIHEAKSFMYVYNHFNQRE